MAQRTEDADDTTPRRMSRGLRVVLFASLAMNLAIVGLVAGFVLNGGPAKPPPRSSRDAVAPYTQALNREDRQAIGRRMFRDLRSEGSRDSLRERASADYTEALGLLRADPFDTTAFFDLLTRQNNRAAARQKRGQEILVDYVSEMTAAERAAFADRVAEHLERYNKKRN